MAIAGFVTKTFSPPLFALVCGVLLGRDLFALLKCGWRFQLGAQKAPALITIGIITSSAVLAGFVPENDLSFLEQYFYARMFMTLCVIVVFVVTRQIRKKS